MADERLQAVQVNLGAHTDNPTWHLKAACRGLHPDTFHPQRGEDTKKAKAMCQTCTVADACLSFALVNFEKHGIWGGKSERERRRLRGQLVKEGLLHQPLTPIDHGTSAGYHAHRRRNEIPCRSCMEARAANEGQFADSA